MNGVHLSLGLPDHLRARAAEIYWQAFGGKLGAVLGPQKRALVFLDRAMNRDHVIVALDEDGRLVGLAGFKTPAGNLAGGDRADLRAAYGWIGALWREGVLRLLAQEIDNERFLIDGICVASGMRGQGLGKRLLAALCDEAVARGYHAIRLDVIDTNWRARALYEREGFSVVKSEPIGWLRLVFGFKASLTMVKGLD